MKQTLLVLAAGLSSRYGGTKQLDPVGPNGEVLLDYGLFDAVNAGFTNATFVIRKELEEDFRSHASRRFGKRIEIDFVFQSLDDVPAGQVLPSERVKPWGTAHAILAARSQVSAPFVVINADDYYGPSAYSLLFDFLEKEEADAVPGFGMIGFRLDENLSQHGGVSRAICTCDESNYLQELIEVKEIENKDGKISGVTVAGAPFPLTGSETTSMNIWGLTPEVFPILEHQFSDYFASFAHDVGSEFLISTALNEQIANGWSTMKVLPARDRGFGMTFKADQPNVALQIERLIAEGKYPANLTDWFNENH